MILGNDIIIKTAVLLAAMTALIAFNLWLFVRRGRSVLFTLFHISSLLGLMGVFCVMMDTVILGLHFEYYFRWAGAVLLTLCFVVLSIALFVFFLIRKKGHGSFHLSPDLKSVFTGIDDLALILDYKGVVVEANHPDKLEALLGNCKTINDILAKLRQKAPGSRLGPLERGIQGIGGKEQLEVHFCPEDEDYLFSISPITSGRSFLGCTLVMHNISEIRRSEKQMRENNQYLEEANQKLESYVKIAGVLEEEKERLRLLEQVQMDLIDKIENTISHVRSIQTASFDSIEACQKEIMKASDMLREAYKELRKSISKISRGRRG